MALFEIRDGVYVSCFMWTAFENERRGDMLGVLFRETPDASDWIFRYRHRWYVDDKVWDSKDEKNAYEMTISASEAEAEVARKVVSVWDMAQQAWPGTKVIEAPRIIWVRSDRAREVMRVLRRQSFAFASEAQA